MEKWRFIALILTGVILITFSWVWAENDLEPLPFPPTTCSLDLYNADIRAVLKAFARTHDLNIALSEDVKGRVTLSFKDIGLGDAFLTIIQNTGLCYTVREGIVEVDTLKNKNEKLGEMERMQENIEKTSPLITKTYTLKYGINPRETIAKEITKGKEIQDLDELASALKERLSKREGAKVTAINRTNTLIITDIPENVEKIIALVKELDTIPKQIAIEAKISEIGSELIRSLGIEWGGYLNSGQFTTTGGVMGTTGVTMSGGTMGSEVSLSPATEGVGLSGWNYAVNFPASVMGEKVSSLAFMIGKVDKRVLDIQFSALEKEGKSKLLSNPKVITQDNQRAYIMSGTEIPIQVIYPTAPGIVTYMIEYKRAAIELEVTPHVVEDGIYMDVVVARKEPDWSRERPYGVPIDTRSITTKVLVKHGDTLVIGGLVREREERIEKRIPWLSRIPFLGRLFKTEIKRLEQGELVIFITPTILESTEQITES